MKTIVVACALMVLGGSSAGAVDINGKWGIGAGVFRGGEEISLIRGKSERSAWLFDVKLAQSYDNTTRDESPAPPFPFVAQTVRRWSILAGPGYRRFTRPTEEFSPYWDVRVRGLYSLTSASGSTGEKFAETGVQGDFSFGLEYFTRWRFSVAAHAGLASLGWSRSTIRHSSGGVETRHIRNSEFLRAGLSPVLFVRGYF